MEQHGNAYFIVQPGGPHVIYLRGNPCPDDIIAAYLLDGELPERMTTCDLPAVDPYVPIPAASVDDYETTLEALSAVDDEINNDPDYWDWDTLQPLTVGCLFGGTVTYAATDSGYDVTLERLRLLRWPGPDRGRGHRRRAGHVHPGGHSSRGAAP